MKFNPFRPTSLVGPGMFRGRGAELISIERDLYQAKHGNPQHFLIEGERGIGKSSLLFFVDALGSGIVHCSDGSYLNFVVVNVELRGSDDQFDIVKGIARDLTRAISEHKTLKELASKVWDFLSNWEVMGVKYNKNNSEAELAEVFDGLVNSLVSLVSEAELELDGVLLLIDEADKPSETAQLGEFVKLLTERLSKRRCDNVLLGLAGLPSLIGKLRLSHESSPRIFEVMSLAPLAPEERKDVVRQGLAMAEQKSGDKTVITEEALDMISTLSEGYPHFIQQFSYSAFEEDKEGTIDVHDVLYGAHKKGGALGQLGIKYFNEMYFTSISSDDYRKVLNTMATHGDDWVSRARILDESGLVEHTVTNALKALKDRNVIIQNDAQRGSYKLPTKSFAAWINALLSVEKRAEDDDEPLLKLD